MHGSFDVSDKQQVKQILETLQRRSDSKAAAASVPPGPVSVDGSPRLVMSGLTKDEFEAMRTPAAEAGL